MVPWEPKHAAVNNTIQSMGYWFSCDAISHVVLKYTLPNHVVRGIRMAGADEAGS